MKKLNKTAKIIISITASAIICACAAILLYIYALPFAVSNEHVLNFIKNSTKNALGAELQISNPRLTTLHSPTIEFSVDSLSMQKKGEKLLNVENFKTTILLSDLFKQKIIIKKLGADEIFIDINKIMTLNAKTAEAKPTKWRVDILNSLLYVKKCTILYSAAPNVKIKVDVSNLEITQSVNPKYVHFNAIINISKNKNIITLKMKDKNSVYTKGGKLYIENCELNVNKSKIFINSILENKNINIKVFSKNFDVADIVKLIETNLVINNGDEILSYFKNIKGNFDFKFNLTNNNIKGNIHFNRGSLTLLPLNNLNITLNKGDVDINQNSITLKGFNGFYSNKKENAIKLEGVIKDYMKSFDTEIVITTAATKEFSTKHLSKIVGYPLEIMGKVPTKIIYKSLYDKIDLIIMSKVNKGDDILVDGASLSPINYDRAVKADLHFENNILNIKSINYYIASVINKNSKIKPILSIYGNVDCTGLGNLKDIGFEIPRALPSEFLNVLIGQKVFKKGTIEGKIKLINTPKAPIVEGNLIAKGVRIPSQRLSIKNANLKAGGTTINLLAEGRYKRSKYEFKSTILNELKLPIIIKDVNLAVDNIDIEKILKSFNNQNLENPPTVATLVQDNNENEENDNDDAVSFNTGLVIIEKCALNLVKGKYKEINFGNLIAELTLDKNGILSVKSNKFDIAEGISSSKIHCDLKNHKYSVVLGVKGINSDIMATSLLNLKKEISGKASGIISLNTDNSLKLNGFMKFTIKNGTIGKIGLVEYVLKFASLFRNPMAMATPSTIADLVNIPEGNFDKIVGDITIKDNAIEKMIIKSSAPQLSSLIVGKINLEDGDSILRIYTKFSNRNKGLAGLLRNLSLNNLANRAPINGRNDANYYSAELEHLPEIDADERDCQIFLTKVDGDVEHNNFLSSLRKIK